MNYIQESIFYWEDDDKTASITQSAHNITQLTSNRGISGVFSSEGFKNVSGAGSHVSDQYFSQIEAAILASTEPLNINETEEINVIGNRGIWTNKSEVVGWKGIIPIEEYSINEDTNPEIISKKIKQKLEYIQELAIRYLRPPTPPAPGEIVIVQERNTCTEPAPPLVIRQIPPRPLTPEPLVIREAPPQPPQKFNRNLITISGKKLPPPPRKVIIERLASLPSKPQSIIIERWLPYHKSKRRVLFQKSDTPDPIIVKPKNVIIQWDVPSVIVKKEIKYLGIIKANPIEYLSKYGISLKASTDLPKFVLDIKTPEGLVLAANSNTSRIHELEGDVFAMKLVDLDREGLSEYKSNLKNLM